MLIIIALMCSAMQYQQVKYACYRSDERSVIPRIRTFTGDLTAPVIKSRVLSTNIVKPFVYKYAVAGGRINLHKLFEITSIWMSFWMFATMLIPIFRSKVPLYWILALFAMSQYHWLPGGRDFVFPYDGPILFAVTAVMLLFHQWMSIAIIPAMAIKETALAMVFTCKTCKQTVIAGAVAITTKISIDIIVKNPILFTQEPTIRLENNLPCIVKNLTMISHGNMHVIMALILIGIGSVYVNNRVRLSIAFYVVCMLFVGVISEYRIWFELLPIILWGIEHKTKKEGGE